MDRKNTVLKFCIRCGQKVTPYNYSPVGYADIDDYGNSYDSPHYKNLEGVVTFRCTCTQTQNLAPNDEDDGRDCPDCGHFMNTFARYCGVCSRAL